MRYPLPNALLNLAPEQSLAEIRTTHIMWYLADQSSICHASEYLLTALTRSARNSVRKGIAQALERGLFIQVGEGPQRTSLYQFPWPNPADNIACCVYCGGFAETAEHLTPKSQGGTKIVPACWDCNDRKGSHPAEAVGLVLRFPTGRRVL